LPGHEIEHQLLIGCGPLSVHYTALIDAMTGTNKKIAGIVSICGDLVGAILAGRTVLGPIDHILEIFAEFENHGVKIGRVVISTLNPADQNLAIDAVSEYCAERDIPISLLTDLISTAAIPSAIMRWAC
jgi:hypothetical protein